jgi:hypothetical protein
MRICLPAGVRSNLDWSKQCEMARVAIENGAEGIVWEFDFGLFNELPSSVDDRGQIETLCLAIDHFQSTLFTEFKPLSVVLYSGGIDWSNSVLKFPKQRVLFDAWVEKHDFNGADRQIQRLYARDAVLDLFQALLARLDGDLNVILEFIPEADLLPHELLQLIAKEKWEHFSLVLGNHELSDPNAEVGILLPDGLVYDSSKWGYLDPLIELFRVNGTPVRLVSETYLTNQWHGMERIIVNRDVVSQLGNRKLLGFIAAGGEVVDLEEFCSNSLVPTNEIVW